MKICEKVEMQKEFPEVVGGDIIKVKTPDYPLYFLVTDNDIGLRLVDIENGTPWSTGSLWGGALNPHQVEVVTDRVCLNVRGGMYIMINLRHHILKPETEWHDISFEEVPETL